MESEEGVSFPVVATETSSATAAIRLPEEVKRRLLGRMQFLQSQTVLSLSSKQTPLHIQLDSSFFQSNQIPIVYEQVFPAHLSIRQLMTFFMYEDSAQYRHMLAYTSPDAIDGAVLSPIDDQRTTHPHCSQTTIVWAAFQAPAGVQNRDLCLLERIGITLDPNGNEIGFILSESVDLEAIDGAGDSSFLQESKSQYVRAEARGIMLFQWSSPDHRLMKVSVIGYMQPNGMIPHWALNNIGKIGKQKERFHRALSFFCPIYVGKVSRQMILSRSKKTRNDCVRCYNKFNLAMKKYTCSVCSDEFCKPCVRTRYFSATSQFKAKRNLLSYKLKRVKICATCLFNSTNSIPIDFPNGDFETQSTNEEIQSPIRTLTEEEKHRNSDDALIQIFDFNTMERNINHQKQLVNSLRGQWSSSI